MGDYAQNLQYRSSDCQCYEYVYLHVLHEWTAISSVHARVVINTIITARLPDVALGNQSNRSTLINKRTARLPNVAAGNQSNRSTLINTRTARLPNVAAGNQSNRSTLINKCTVEATRHSGAHIWIINSHARGRGNS